MGRVPDVIADWVKDYITGEGSEDITAQTIQQVQSRADIPDSDGIYYVTDEDALVARINS